jgi:hypothetical protein
MSTTVKPVKLQVNTSGAWKDVIRFDAANDVESCEVMGAAETLGRVSKAKFRITTDDGLQQALKHWAPDTGWKDHKWPPR